MVSIHVWPFDTHANEYIPGANCSFPRAVSAGLQRDNCWFHLTGWLKDGAEMKPGCFPALFPGFRICVEKLKYKTLKHPHTPACGGSRLHSPGGRSVLLFKGWTGRLLKLGSDNTGPEGFAHPCVSLKRCLYLTITYLGVIFWNRLKRAYFIINISQKSLTSHKLWKETEFWQTAFSAYIVKSLRSWRPALRIFSDLVFQRNVFWSCKYLEARIKSKSEMLCWSWIFRDKGQLFITMKSYNSLFIFHLSLKHHWTMEEVIIKTQS